MKNFNVRPGMKASYLCSLFLGVSAHAIEPISVNSSTDDGNVANNTIDNNLNTRWSANGDGQWIQYDLGVNVPLESVGVAFYKGDQRDANIQIELSLDASNWQIVWTGVQPLQTLGLQSFEAFNTDARYVRVVGYGNSSNSWNSITEVDIVEAGVTPTPTPTPAPTPTPTPAPTPTPTPTPTPDSLSVTASTDDGNVAENVLDGDLATRWSANGDGQYITFNLGTLELINSVDVAFFKGDQRSASFDVLVGATESSFTQVFTGSSSGNTTDLENYSFVEEPGQYLRIVGHGNSSNSWNSITEVQINTEGDVIDLPPTAQITATSSTYINETVSFSSAGSIDPDGGALIYDWSFGDGNFSTEASPSHSYSSSGDYAVNLTITDNEGDTASVSHSISVSGTEAPPVANISAPGSAQSGQPVSFNASNSYDPDGGDIASYEWSFSDGSSDNGINVQKTFLTDGTYSATLVVTDDEGETASASSSISISSVIESPELWPFGNASFEGSLKADGWIEVNDEPGASGLIKTSGSSDAIDGSRVLVIAGGNVSVQQAVYKPVAGHVYQVTAYVYGHGLIEVEDVGTNEITQVTTNHGSSWQQVSVNFLSTGSPAIVHIKAGAGTGDARFDLIEVADISTAADLAKPAPANIIRYPSQIIDLAPWKLTLPVNTDVEIYTPDLLKYSVDPWFKVVEDEDGYAVQFRANHGGSTTGGSSNPRSELREMQQYYTAHGSEGAASWSNTQGTHELYIKQKVTRLTSIKPHVVVGQIHDSGDDVVVFRLEGLLGEGAEYDNNGTVGVLDTHAKLWITNGNTRHGYLVDGNYELGTVFSVKFIAHDGVVDFEYNGEPVPYTHTGSFSGAYFKVGNYTQSHDGSAPGESSDAYAETLVYDYYIKHD